MESSNATNRTSQPQNTISFLKQYAKRKHEEYLVQHPECVLKPATD